jgi:hypothetical protein
MKRSPSRPRLRVSADGENVVGHAGARLLSDLADAVGLTEALSVVMASTKQRRRGHDRGQVLVDVATMIADGGEAISDLAVLRDQPSLFGEVASVPTAWRTLEAIDAETLEAIARARAAARAVAWRAGADPGFYVIDFDGTLIGSHSEKEGAAPTYKRGFGFHPLVAILDGTGEALAAILRPGNAASNTTADHVALLGRALAQLPVDPAEVDVIARADSAALTHGFVDACGDANVRFIIGHDLTEPIRNACLRAPARRWQPAITADGSDERDGADVAEITDLVDLSRWPPDTRAIARREQPHPGAQLTFTDADGHRFQVLITDLADTDISYLEALHRGRGRAEKRICDLKDTGLTNLPSADFAINTAWMTIALVAHDLLCWSRRLVLDGDLARAEPKRLRYCLLHTAGLIARTARRVHLRLARDWPWANNLVAAFNRVQTLHLRT